MDTAPGHPFPPPDCRLTRDAAIVTIMAVAPKLDRLFAARGIHFHDRCDLLQEAAATLLTYVGKTVGNPAGLLWRIAVRLASHTRRRPRTLPLFSDAAIPDRRPPAWERDEDREHLRVRAEAAVRRCPPAVARVARLALDGGKPRDIALALLDGPLADAGPTSVSDLEHRVRVYLSRFAAVARRAA